MKKSDFPLICEEDKQIQRDGDQITTYIRSASVRIKNIKTYIESLNHRFSCKSPSSLSKALFQMTKEMDESPNDALEDMDESRNDTLEEMDESRNDTLEEMDESRNDTLEEMDEPLQSPGMDEPGDSRGESKAWPSADAMLTNQVSTHESFISFSMDQLVC
jgi:hypothetical protein